MNMVNNLQNVDTTDVNNSEKKKNI